jgi:hypothetical protein
MEFKSKELQNAVDKPSSFTVPPSILSNKSDAINELRKHFLLLPGNSNKYFDLGTLTNTNNKNPLVALLAAFELHYLSLIHI